MHSGSASDAASPCIVKGSCFTSSPCRHRERMIRSMVAVSTVYSCSHDRALMLHIGGPGCPGRSARYLPRVMLHHTFIKEAKLKTQKPRENPLSPQPAFALASSATSSIVFLAILEGGKASSAREHDSVAVGVVAMAFLNLKDDLVQKCQVLEP